MGPTKCTNTAEPPTHAPLGPCLYSHLCCSDGLLALCLVVQLGRGQHAGGTTDPRVPPGLEGTVTVT